MAKEVRGAEFAEAETPKASRSEAPKRRADAESVDSIENGEWVFPSPTD